MGGNGPASVQSARPPDTAGPADAVHRYPIIFSADLGAAPVSLALACSSASSSRSSMGYRLAWKHQTHTEKASECT